VTITDDLYGFEQDSKRGRPKKVDNKKALTVRLSPTGEQALAQLERLYRQAGVGAYTRHTLIERLIMDAVPGAERLVENTARWRDELNAQKGKRRRREKPSEAPAMPAGELKGVLLSFSKTSQR
jgi:hypothetical protein